MSDPSSKQPPQPPPRSPPDPEGPPRLERVRPPVATYGMAQREVGADAAIAAGLAMEGSLARDSALRLFGLAAATRATGRLTLAPEGRRYALSFRRGVVEHAASSDPADEPGRFLVRRGAVSPEQLVEAEAARAAAGGDLVAALVASGRVAPADAARLLAEHGAAVIARALASAAGGWSWEPGVAPPPGAFPLGSPFAALGAAVRALDAGAVRARLGDRAGRAASAVAGRVRLDELRLTPQEARAAAALDGGRSPAELAEASGGDALTVLQVSLLLADLDLLAFGAARPPPPKAPPGPAEPGGGPGPAAPAPAPPRPPSAAVTTPPSAPRPPAATPPPAAPSRAPATAAPPAAPPTAPRAAPRPPPAEAVRGAEPPALAAEPLRALAARLASADHFEALSLPRDAPPGRIKAAYLQLAKLYHPDAVPAGATAEVRALSAQVFARMSEAWSTLGDDARRARYLEELRSGGGADVDVAAILEAENAFQAGTVLVKARRYQEARARFDEAIRLNPGEAEFRVWRAWCDFLLAPDRRRQHAASAAAVEAALAENPLCAPGFLFLGQMAKLVGDLGQAERHLRRGLAVAPEHPDLVRELKYLRR